VLTIGAILAAEWLFVNLTHALQIQAGSAKLTAPQTAAAAVANHEYLIIAMLLGAIIGMLSSFGVMDPTARGQLATMLFMPVVMVPALALGIELGGHRVLALVSLAVVLAIGTYCRRFGPRGFIAGMLLFMGDFFGYFLHSAITMGDLGWVVAEIGVGLLVAIVVRFALFYPHPLKALDRTQRSYLARARKVAGLALVLYDDPGHGERDARRLRRQLIRLNEAALMIDGQLGDPNAVADGSSGQLLHQRLFDAELALTNMARFSEAMSRLDLPAGQRAEVRLALLNIVRENASGARTHAASLIGLLRSDDRVPSGEYNGAAVVPRRFAVSVIALADAMTDWISLGMTAEGKGTFQPSVNLFGGWLPGSSQVSAAASAEPGTRRGDRVHLQPYTRTAIQMGIAVGGAIALGDLLSPQRFYWAAIAAFITFMGANNAGEQVRKALFRVAGTVVGIGAGLLLADVIGGNTALSIAVILAALFLGFYLMRINYAFMVMGITVMVSQLYVQLGEFSDSLLLLRLEETAIGAAVAIAVVVLVLPLRTRRVLRIALRAHIQAVGQMADHASGYLAGEDSDAALHADARAVDASYQALVATAQPLRRNLFGSLDEETGQVMRLASAARNYSRNLVGDVESTGPVDAGTRAAVATASRTLHDSVEAVAGAITGSRDVTYTRSSALFEWAERRLDGRFDVTDGGQLAIRDLKLIDGAMALMAEALGLTITDYDTADGVTDADAADGEQAGYRSNVVRGGLRSLDRGGVAGCAG
jgi:uncharacterized membrane protein YgaE (UPF0421/DUF939 family)